MRKAVAALILFTTLALPAIAEEAKPPGKLAVTKILAVKEIEPAVFQIAIELEGGTITILQMNAFTLLSLQAQVNKVGQ